MNWSEIVVVSISLLLSLGLLALLVGGFLRIVDAQVRMVPELKRVADVLEKALADLSKSNEEASRKIDEKMKFMQDVMTRKPPERSVPPQIQAIEDAIQKIQKNGQLTPPLRQAVLSVEKQRAGPVPDVPAIKWTNNAIMRWLRTEHDWDLARPTLAERDPQTGDFRFTQEKR